LGVPSWESSLRADLQERPLAVRAFDKTALFQRLGDEATLFRLAAQLEQAQPWFERVPAGY